MEHVGRGMIVLEVFVLRLGQDGGRKRTEPLAVLDASVQHILHVGQARVGDDGTIAESARSPLHAPLKPTHNIALDHLIGNRVEQRSAIEPPILHACAFQALIRSALRKTRDRGKRDSFALRPCAAVSAPSDTCATRRRSPGLHRRRPAESRCGGMAFGKTVCRWPRC